MPLSASTDINADKLAEFFVEKVSSACCHQQCAAASKCSPWCISTTSVKFPLRMWWRVWLSKFRPRQKQWRASVEDWRVETIGVTHPLWKISGYATVRQQHWPTRSTVSPSPVLAACQKSSPETPVRHTMYVAKEISDTHPKWWNGF